MSITKTIGGERLGSGKKMKATMHAYERSTHDLSYVWRSTQSAGTLVPFMKELVLPGDTFDIDLDCEVLTHPTIGPLFGSYKVQLDVFECPIRLYQRALHNNKLGIGMNMSSVKLPQLEVQIASTNWNTMSDESQINPSCILAYLGIRGIGRRVASGTATRQFNAVPYLAYWDIFKNYYANKQETNAIMIHAASRAPVDSNTAAVGTLQAGGTQSIPKGAPGAQTLPLWYGTQITVTYTAAVTDPRDLIFVTGTGEYSADALFAGYDEIAGPPTQRRYWGIKNYNIGNIIYYKVRAAGETPTEGITLTPFPLENIDTMREALLAAPTTTPFIISSATTTLPYSGALQRNGNYNSAQYSQEGLAVKTYQSDIYNNWMKTEWITGAGSITEITRVSTTGNSFTIDALNLAKKVYNMLNRIAISGGTYDDWLETVYTHDGFRKVETPIYHGGLSKELVFQEVVANSASSADGVNQPLGQLAGRGVMSSKNKGGKITIKVNEPGYIIGIVSLTPRIDYSQGNDWQTNLKTMDDLHKPALDEIGYQDLITDQMAWWDTTIDSSNGLTFRSAGKQPAWLNYMTNVNQVYGNFAIASNEMFMTLNRRYEKNSTTFNINDLTTYIDPAKFNNIFADTALDAQNFWTQIRVGIEARRKMSAKIIPNL